MTSTAQTYGESLYELARDEQLGGEILEQLHMTVALFRENPDYISLLSLPSVPKKERCAVLDESLRGQVHPYLLNFLKILVENGTIRELNGCEETFRNHYYEDNGIMEVTAITAVPLTDALQEKLRKNLEAKTGKTILLNSRVDTTVLGGVRLELADERLDSTVRNRLDGIARLLRDTML